MMTDKAQLYRDRLRDFASHDRVDHSKGEYVREEDGKPLITTNTVESYLSVFKRGMRGTYQHCKEKHLHRYLAEFDFRHNNRVALKVDDATRAAEIYAERFARPNGRIAATFEVLFLHGWAPHASQPKALRPGSAAHRLSEALGTTEHSTGVKAGRS